MKKLASVLVVLLSLTATANEAVECKDVLLEDMVVSVCFPEGHVCMDPHGIGYGKPIPTDCWDGGSRACNADTENWPTCAGGFIEI